MTIGNGAACPKCTSGPSLSKKETRDPTRLLFIVCGFYTNPYQLLPNASLMLAIWRGRQTRRRNW